MNASESGPTASERIGNTLAYLFFAWAVVIVSLVSYYLLRPWLIENTTNHYAIYAIWLVTTIGVIYVMSRQF